MTEDLLVFVSIIAVWKIVQVWRLKRRLKAKQGQLVAVRQELNRTAEILDGTSQSLARYTNYYGPTAFPDDTKRPIHVGRTVGNQPLDLNWPEVLD